MADPEYLSPQDLKQLAIATVTSALMARQLESPEERLKQFGDDFIMLMDDTTGTDIFRLASLLADMSASVVEQMAVILQSSPDSVMQYLAQQMLGTDISEGGGSSDDE